MSDRDDFAELVASARNVTKCSSFYFNGRIRYGTKNERIEERFLCMDAARVYICSMKIPVKIVSHFNILALKLIEKCSDSHVIIEADEKQVHSLYGLHDKASLQPFLIVLIRCLHDILPHRLASSLEIRPENEYDRLLGLSNDYFGGISSGLRPCGGFSLRYECASDLHQVQCYRSVQNLVDTVFAHRITREFTLTEFEALTQKDWLPIIGALRHNEWFTKLTIENTKLSTENIDELCAVALSCKAIKDLRLMNCGLRQDFGARFNHCLSVTHIENIDLSNNALEDKGLVTLCSSLSQRKLPIRSFNLQSCSISHRSLHVFHSALIANNYLLKSLRILNLSGNRVKDENCITLLFSNPENVLEELHLTDIEFSLETFFHSLATMSCKLRRLYISPIKSLPTTTTSGGVKAFFTKNQTLEILQLSNANLSSDFLRELCDGLHSNVHLNKLDLRLSGNQLESFVRDYASRFATIPCLTTLDITGCDLDNEIPTLLNELKKNRTLKSLHLGRNFNNIKTKNMQRTIYAMRELIVESELEYFSIADSKLKENTADFLFSLLNNTSLKSLDIRGNLMGDAGVRVLTHILQTNRHLHTIYFDRNLLSLNNFEEIVNAMEGNSVIEYLPIPVTDITLMKTSEKDRIEKLQYLMTRLDALCTRNHEQKENLSPSNSLRVTTAANLTREMNIACENQQQLFGDQTSLEYILSCSNRTNQKNEEIQTMLARSARIAKIPSQLYELYVKEEEELKNEWNEICELFEGKIIEKNERLSRKFYQLFKEQTAINYDDKFQEQIRTYFSNSNDQINHFLTEEIPSRLATYTRECYINVASSLQKRAYDITNDIIMDMHKQLEIIMSQIPTPVTTDGPHTAVSTLDRLVSRGTNAVHRLANKHNPSSTDYTDETNSNRALKKADSNESLADPPLKPNRLQTTTPSKAPASPKPPPPPVADWRRSILINSGEQESDQIYHNVPNANRKNKKEILLDDEGDLIEHEILDIVEQEELKEQKQQKRNTPPALPEKKRKAPATQENNLDIELEPTDKLVHPAKSRPRPAKRQPPGRRGTNGVSQDSSSDGGLDNDDNSITDAPTSSTIETVNADPSDPPTTELPPKVMTKAIKSALKPSKTASDEPPPVPAKAQLQSRIAITPQQPASSLLRTNSMSKSTVSPPNDSPQIINSDFTQEALSTKVSMSTSSHGILTSSNRDESKETENSPPSVVIRTGKVALGTRVLPPIDPNGEVPQVKLRPLQIEKKAPALLPGNASSLEHDTGDTLVHGDNEQYKRLSVKERARMLTTTVPPMSSNEKKAGSPSNTTVPSPYTPRTPRRLIEQVNLFC